MYKSYKVNYVRAVKQPSTHNLKTTILENKLETSMWTFLDFPIFELYGYFSVFLKTHIFLKFSHSWFLYISSLSAHKLLL